MAEPVVRPLRSGTDAARVSAWSPLRASTFRALWLAQFAGLIGTWMHTVGAQWLLIDELDAAALVSLVQTATLLPMLLLAMPAGVLADSLDRRRLLAVVQVCTVVVGLVLTVLTSFRSLGPWALLGLTFLLGSGQAVSMPAWQALVPDIVPREQIRPAVGLSAVSMNGARAIGPAAAGLLIAEVSVAAVFALTTLFYAAVAVAVFRWAPSSRVSGEGRERFVPALRAGARYVTHSKVYRRLLLRTAMFVLPGSAVWALLPLVAARHLGLSSGGYGLLLASLGVGAVAGAALLGPLGARLSLTVTVAAATALFAGAQAGIVFVDAVPQAVLLLVPAGAAWLLAMASLGAATQVFLPEWVRARGLSIAQVVFMGGQAVGAVIWGVVANAAGLVTAFVAASALMLLGALTIVIWPLHDVSQLDSSTAVHWPDPQMITTPGSDDGPVLITVTFTVPPENAAAFMTVMRHVRASRRRTGAVRWNLYRDAADSERFVESFVVPSWGEHLRQHTDRQTVIDQQIDQEVRALAATDPHVTHLLPARKAARQRPPSR